jgi:hypothetical protein
LRSATIGEKASRRAPVTSETEIDDQERCAIEEVARRILGAPDQEDEDSAFVIAAMPELAYSVQGFLT